MRGGLAGHRGRSLPLIPSRAECAPRRAALSSPNHPPVGRAAGSRWRAGPTLRRLPPRRVPFVQAARRSGPDVLQAPAPRRRPGCSRRCPPPPAGCPGKKTVAGNAGRRAARPGRGPGPGPGSTRRLLRSCSGPPAGAGQGRGPAPCRPRPETRCRAGRGRRLWRLAAPGPRCRTSRASPDAPWSGQGRHLSWRAVGGWLGRCEWGEELGLAGCTDGQAACSLLVLEQAGPGSADEHLPRPGDPPPAPRPDPEPLEHLRGGDPLPRGPAQHTQRARPLWRVGPDRRQPPG